MTLWLIFCGFVAALSVRAICLWLYVNGKVLSALLFRKLIEKRCFRIQRLTLSMDY